MSDNYNSLVPSSKIMVSLGLLFLLCMKIGPVCFNIPVYILGVSQVSDLTRTVNFTLDVTIINTLLQTVIVCVFIRIFVGNNN